MLGKIVVLHYDISSFWLLSSLVMLASVLVLHCTLRANKLQPHLNRRLSASITDREQTGGT